MTFQRLVHSGWGKAFKPLPTNQTDTFIDVNGFFETFWLIHYIPINLMAGTCFPADETQTKFQWERKPVGFDCALASSWDLLSQDKSLDDFFWIIGLGDFFDFTGLINSTCVCLFNLRVYPWHAHKDSPTRKWYCLLWSLLATDDTCSSSSTNLGNRVSALRAWIPARPFCKAVATSMKHCSLSAYFSTLQNSFAFDYVGP